MSKNTILCWEVFKCRQMDCPAYKSKELHCWLHSGTQCRGEIQGKFIEKLEMCLGCEVFKRNMGPTEMGATCELIIKQFNHYRSDIERRDREKAEATREMEAGLSEVFEALKQISKGDPTVRIEEDSGLDLIRRLKQFVNATAENLGEIVDLSHEFAMGLAEHFDVLHRVTSGDLSARVQSTSEVELLESLKTVTNHMIGSVALEIDEKRRTEKDLRESESRFRMFAEKAPMGISIMQSDFTFEYVNPMFTEIFGYTLEDIPDRGSWWQKADPGGKYREYHERCWEEELMAATPEKEIRPEKLAVTCGNGEEKIINFRPVILPDGKIFMTYADVTEQTRSEEAIKESEEKYRMLVENIQDGVFIHQDGIIKYVNGAMAGMLGYSPEEVIDQPVENFIAPEEWPSVEEQLHTEKREYTVRMVHKDPKISVFVRANASVFQYRNRMAHIGTMKDITQRLRGEAEKKKLEAQLQRSRQMEAIGTLAGGVAHDLNNILSGIVSYPELLLMDLARNSPLRKPLLTIQRSGEKASAIVQDLLTLARRAVSSVEVVNLNDIIMDLLGSPELERLQSFHPSVRIETELARDLLNLSGSPVHLSKTVMNLISNAAEAMPEGGTVKLHTANRYIDQAIRGYDEVEEGDYVILTVTDTGIGIPQEDLDRIFEPFFTKKVMGRSGTGLGMAVVWGTVKDHHGYIDVVSEENLGTAFTLYFPASREDAGKKALPVGLERFHGRGESVLVVDDVLEQREIAAAILTKLGYDVHTAASGEDAVAYLQTNKVDLLLLDMIMAPGMDGLEAYQRMLEIRPGQKAIVASGFSLSSRVEEIQRMGAGPYIKKPYSLEKIAMTVRSELDK